MLSLVFIAGVGLIKRAPARTPQRPGKAYQKIRTQRPIRGAEAFSFLWLKTLPVFAETPKLSELTNLFNCHNQNNQ
jgi:hypothetical protein